MKSLVYAGLTAVVGLFAVSCASDPASRGAGSSDSETTTITVTSTVAATTTSGTAPGDQHASTSSVGDTTTTLDDGCDSTLPSTTFPGDGLQTFHTLVPGTSDLEFTVAATPTTICPGGVLHLSVTMHNPTDHSIEETPVLVSTSAYPHVVIATLSRTEVPAGATKVVATEATVPELPRGKYEIFVLSARSPEGATIQVEDPSG